LGTIKYCEGLPILLYDLYDPVPNCDFPLLYCFGIFSLASSIKFYLLQMCFDKKSDITTSNLSWMYFRTLIFFLVLCFFNFSISLSDQKSRRTYDFYVLQSMRREMALIVKLRAKAYANSTKGLFSLAAKTVEIGSNVRFIR
jgi:hypothetical protein